MPIGILIFGGLVVAILAGIALTMWRKVWVQNSENAERLRDLEDKKAAHQAYIKDSLRVICETLLRDEMNLSEGAIRLKVLLDNWEQPERGNQVYPAIEGLHDAVAHFDTHGRRKALSKPERRSQDREREKIEAEQSQAFLSDVRALLKHLKPAVH